jgi:cob(I)alamin adenosyltransferase
MQIESSIKKSAKDQRLFNLQRQMCELQMDLAAYEANEDSAGAERAKKLMESCEKSYVAIEAMTVD